MQQQHTTRTRSSRSGGAVGVVVRALAFLGVALGGAAAGVAMYMAWQHNPQGEFHRADGVHWPALGSLGLAWFVVVALPFVVAAVVGHMMLRAPRGRGRT